MKTNYISKIGGLAMVLALTLGFALSAQAQLNATGNDGITASPKAREFLGYTRNQTVAAPAVSQAMKCAMCKNELTTRTDYTARGANKPTVTVATHLCKMCDTELKTVGAGKTAKTLAVHACDGCSMASVN